jgi:hypothetical protein
MLMGSPLRRLASVQSLVVQADRETVASNSTAPIAYASIINSSNGVKAATEGNLGNASAAALKGN